MSNLKENLSSNNNRLLEIHRKINDLKNNGGNTGGSVNLPSLTNEGTASDLLYGKELINSRGQKVTGTFTIDSELTEQTTLLNQLETAITELETVVAEKKGSN